MNLKFQTSEIERDRVALAKVKHSFFEDYSVYVVLKRDEQSPNLLKLETGGLEQINLSPDEIIEFAYLDEETK